MVIAKIIAAAMLATIAPSIVLADGHAINAPDTASATVSLADLDLRTAQGVTAAHARLARQALRLCRKFSDTRRISDRQTLADCTRDAMAQTPASASLPSGATR